MAKDWIAIIDFGGQYKELIARRVREHGVYSEILPWNVDIEELRARAPKGIIFTGGPESVYAEGSKICSKEMLELGVPVLGICYGMQLLAHLCGGRVAPSMHREYGVFDARLDSDSELFRDFPWVSDVLMSHTDQVFDIPEGFVTVASTERCKNAAMECPERGLYGVQFHPEVENTSCGEQFFSNFVLGICGCSRSYTMEGYIKEQIEAVRARVGSKKVLLGLSGGVDSSVCAALLARAIPGQLSCVYVDHGFMRKNETQEIEQAFSSMDLDLRIVDASEAFIGALEGVTDPETKRKTIGKLFADTFASEAGKIAESSQGCFLAQGTIYPDVVESGTDAAVIKSHHNVGGLPKDLGFEGVIEPLRMLFKDEVRAIGRILGLPESIVSRQPFPGPGLAIRIIGEVTREKLDILREADAIVREEFAKEAVKPDQYFAALTNMRSVGVMGDYRTYDYAAAVRAVKTNDFMTCEFFQPSWETLSRISSRITNEVEGVNRVLFDISGKPPATIEFE